LSEHSFTPFTHVQLAQIHPPSTLQELLADSRDRQSQQSIQPDNAEVNDLHEQILLAETSDVEAAFDAVAPIVPNNAAVPGDSPATSSASAHSPRPDPRTTTYKKLDCPVPGCPTKQIFNTPSAVRYVLFRIYLALNRCCCWMHPLWPLFSLLSPAE